MSELITQPDRQLSRVLDCPQVNSRDAYLAFLRRKIPQAEQLGFEPLSEPHPSLFPHQRDICYWMCRGGRRADFAAFGLGKTRKHIQLAIWIVEKTRAKYLIIAPLGVRQEFTRVDGPAMGVDIQFVRTSQEIIDSPNSIFITNYESVRDGKIDIEALARSGVIAGAGLDEAAILRSFGSKTYQEFLPLFRHVPYRFVFTATPSPNRYKELIHYGGFLGVMDTGEALTRFFQRDSSKANNLTLYPHMEGQFWHWLSTWAVFITKPSDLGYSDDGYDLPPLNVEWHKIDDSTCDASVDSWGQHQLFRDQSVGLKESAASKRNSIQLRVARALELINEAPDRHWLIWHDLESERHEIERAIPNVKTIYGSQDLDEREEKVLAFSRGEISRFGTKPILSGSGCNFQRHCSDALFLGVGYKFADFIQAIHRLYRFQQSRQVNIRIVYLESESAIRDDLLAKWRRHDELVAKMTSILRQYGLNKPDLRRAA